MKVYAGYAGTDSFFDDPDWIFNPANELKPKGPINENYFPAMGGNQEMSVDFGFAMFFVGGRNSIINALKLYPPHYLFHPRAKEGVKDQMVLYRREVKINFKKAQILMVTPTHMTSTIVRSDLPVRPDGLDNYLLPINGALFALSISVADISKIVDSL